MRMRERERAHGNTSAVAEDNISVDPVTHHDSPLPHERPLFDEGFYQLRRRLAHNDLPLLRHLCGSDKGGELRAIFLDTKKKNSKVSALVPFI